MELVRVTVGPPFSSVLLMFWVTILLLTWQGRYHDQEECLPRGGLNHCTLVVLTPCESPKILVIPHLTVAFFYSSVLVSHDSEPLHTIPGP